MNDHRLHPAWRLGGHTHTHTHTPSWTSGKQPLFPRPQTGIQRLSARLFGTSLSKGRSPSSKVPGVLERSPIFCRVPRAGKLEPPPPAPASPNTEAWTRMHARVHVLKIVTTTISVISISSHLPSGDLVPRARRALQVQL